MLAAADYLPATHWLMKTEPDVFSFDQLLVRRQESWDGVRNYQARNYMRDHMKIGHHVLVYHSGISEPCVAGLAKIVGLAVPDPSAWDPKSLYFDGKSRPEAPTWFMVTIGSPEALPRSVTLAAIKADPIAAGMLVSRPGQRLSVQPVSSSEFARVLELAGMKEGLIK